MTCISVERWAEILSLNCLALWPTWSLPLHFLAFKYLTLALPWYCLTFSPDLVNCTAGQLPSPGLTHLSWLSCFPLHRPWVLFVVEEEGSEGILVAPYWTTQPYGSPNYSMHDSWLSFSTFQVQQDPAVPTQKASRPLTDLWMNRSCDQGVIVWSRVSRASH